MKRKEADNDQFLWGFGIHFEENDTRDFGYDGFKSKFLKYEFTESFSLFLWSCNSQDIWINVYLEVC